MAETSAPDLRFKISDSAAAGPRPRRAVLEMAPYSPPTAGRAGKLRLDFNENTVGCSPRVIEYLKRRLDPSDLATYPEYERARRDLAAFLRVGEPELLLTNGTDEAIQVLVNTYVDDGDDVLLLRPSYAMCRFYAELAGASVREIPYHIDDLSFPLEELLDALRLSTRLVMLANPNNPTGTGVALERIEQILDRASPAAVLIDEAYFEFCGVTAMGLIGKRPNLFVSRTFSKVYGMAAMRCGCLVTQSANAQHLAKAQSPYSVNSLAVLAATAAVQDQDYVAEYVKEVLAGRDLAYEGLRRLGIRSYPSQANFILFDAGDRAIPVRDALRERGILVRDRSYELPGCVRVTIGTRPQVNRFLEELEKVWSTS
jgi:histidinol-phosphate aminotransferase